ncbi:hypothetical protein [Brachybacterium sp. UNK5269]|uniref:hypothetical protein n=1 Tax=Brachybacterium sp. UNK5269 TaxID=3408576 RepID=UPI003BAE290C
MSQKTPDLKKTTEFGRGVYNQIWQAPFGSLPKSELEILLFTELVRSGIVDLDTVSNFDLARELRCSPTRASNLVFSYRLREAGEAEEYEVKQKLAEVTKIVTDLKNSRSGSVTLNVEDRFWQNELINRMKKSGVYTDSAFNRERVVVDEKSFFNACPDLFGDQGRRLKTEANKAARKKQEVLASLLKKAAGGSATKAGASAVAAIGANPSVADLAQSIASML